MNKETILQEKANKYFVYFDENQKKAILEAMDSFANPFISEHKSDEKKANKIIEIVKNYYNVAEGYNTTRSRKQELRFARQNAMYLIRQLTRLSTSKIGAMFNRDHTTVISATKKINDQLWYDKKFEIEMSNLKLFIHEKID
jgi:chromosomal replication initiation ATPase DnaA